MNTKPLFDVAGNGLDKQPVEVCVTVGWPRITIDLGAHSLTEGLGIVRHILHLVATKGKRRRQKSRTSLLETLRQFPHGETARTLREKAGLSGKRFTTLIRTLVDEGIVEPCTITKGHRRYDGYRLAKPESQPATD